MKLRMQAVLVGMLLVLALLAVTAGVAWSTGAGMGPDIETISSGPQIGPGDGGG